MAPKAAKKTAKTRPTAAVAKPAAPSKAELEAQLAAKEGAEKLSTILQEIVACYDKDGDGFVERVEFLEGEELRRGCMDFGPKERKAAFQWFKDTGAEGKPVDGMYVSNGKFAEALQNLAMTESGVSADETGALADWLYENRAKDLFEAVYKTIAEQKHTTSAEVAKIRQVFLSMDTDHNGVLSFEEIKVFFLKIGMKPDDSKGLKDLFDSVDKNKNDSVSWEEFLDFIFDKPASGASGSAAEGGTAAPVYPLTIAYSDLAKELDKAVGLGRNVLILQSGKDRVDRYLQYQTNSLLDCKQIIVEVSVKKSKSKEEWQETAKEKAMNAMYYMGFCKPLWIHLSNTAFDLTGFCSDRGLPEDIFASKEVWTVQKACDMNLVTEPQKFDLSIDDDKKWKGFHVIITSLFDLQGANDHLVDKIPHYDDLAILVIDPSSID